MSNSNLPTIEEWLALKEWTYVPSVTEGVYGDYHWVNCDDWIFEEELLNELLPNTPFQILVTFWDWNGGAADVYGKIPGWMAIGNFAICDLTERMPDLNLDPEAAFMVIDRQISNDTILEFLNEFKEFNPYFEDNNAFWDAVQKIRPYCYISDLGDGGIFAARGKQLYSKIVNERFMSGIVERRRAELLYAREQTWHQIGPECGPEICVEVGCSRLRIQLAVKCFLHQLECSRRAWNEY